MLQPRKCLQNNVFLFENNEKIISSEHRSGDSVPDPDIKMIGLRESIFGKQKTWWNLAGKSVLIYVICIAVFARIQPAFCQEVDVEGSEDIDVTRLRRDVGGGERDLTTVLLLGNQNNAGDFNKKAGRYLSVKPVIGLLTSTARTFIQDGVTTEYATQILGTTLDNGRIYAQVLTKSSLVLYNKPTDRDDPYLVKPTKLPSFDGSWNVKQDLGFINPDKFFLKNTDYISPQSDKMFTVYASKPVKHDYTKLWNAEVEPDITSRSVEQEATEETPVRIQEMKDIPRYSENDDLNLLDAPVSENERRIKTYFNSVVSENKDKDVNSRNHKSLNSPVDVKEQASNHQEVTVEKVLPLEIRPEKIKPDASLPTFTVKNEFSPIFYYIDNVESKKGLPKENMVDNANRNPKNIFAHKSESRPKTTFTYEGFADFTTMVGDTVIVFTPNTAKVSPGQQGERLEQLEPSAIVDFDKESITKVKQVFPTNAPILPHTTFVRPEDAVRSSKALNNDEDSLNNVLYENVMPNEDQSLDSSTEIMLDAAISSQDGFRLHHNHNFGLNVDVIQPSELSYTTINRVQATQKLEKDQLGSVLLDSEIEPIVSTSARNGISNSETVFEVTPEKMSEEVTEPIIPETEGTTERSSETTTQTSPTVKDEEEDEEKEEVQTSQDDVEGWDIEESPIETPSKDATCTDGIIPLSTMTTAFKTLTYLTTFFIPLEGTDTTTSIKSHEVLASDIGFITNFECKTKMIQPSEVVPVVIQTKIQSSSGEDLPNDFFMETATKAEVDALTTTEKRKELIEEQKDITTSTEATTQRRTTETREEYTERAEDEHATTTEHSNTTTESHVLITVTTENMTETTVLETFTEAEESDVNDTSNVNNKENEIDLIYKTLYTTYRYFTTFFQGSTSSIATHKSVVTNVITSTVDWSDIDPSIMKAFDNEYEGHNDYEIAPTSVGIGRPTESILINSLIDLVQHRDVIESVQNDQAYISQLPTPELAVSQFDSIKPDAVKTYYTTYTFFTTIYVGDDANVCSRSEIYTNYVGPESLVPTATSKLGDMTTKKTEFDFRNCKQVPGLKKGQEVEEDKIMTVSEEEDELNIDRYHSYSSIIRTPAIEQPTKPNPIEVDMLFSVAPDMEDGRFVTDVKSSSSKGEKMIIDNAVLDDQISSESNIDEIMPSPTLLLQTSYTTFTYFTTMYIGKDSSNIKSRLETITNVVTETLSPKRPDELEEANLPITYYTTFTYWTTLYKDKSTAITSREEVISNIVKPSVLPVPIDSSPIDTDPIEVDTNLAEEIDIKPSVMIDDLNQDDEKATFYTTYTYFTTFYVGNTSQIRSSLETVTNIVDNTKDPINDNQIARAVGNGAPKNNLVDEDVKPNIVPTVLKEVIKPTKLEGSSIFSTSLIGTYIDNLYAEVQPITPSNVAKPDTEPRILSSQVAIISGGSTIITNEYDSIKNESNPNFAEITTSTLITSPTPDVIQSSVTDPTTPEDTGEQDEEQEQEEEESVDEDDGSNSKKKSRLAYQTRSRTFTPVIRPFASRNRPTFSPKRVSLVGGVTTITRSDFTPTITATPALKSVKSSGFAVKKQPSSSIINGSSRKFGSGRGSSVISSASGSRAAGFGRSKSILDIQPSSRRTGFRSSSAGFNGNTPNRGASSRISPSLSSRVRGKTLSSSARYQDYATTIFFDEEENDDQTSTQALDETSEAGIRKTNNPTFKFRRPGARAPGSGPAQRTTTVPSSRKGSSTRGRVTTTTSRTTTKSTPNPLFALRNRNRPNALFPPRGFLKQTEPPVEEVNNEEEVDQVEEEQFAEDEEFGDADSDYDSSDKKEQQVSTTQTPRRNSPLIRPFVGFRRRSKRQVDYGTRKHSNFRRPGTRTTKRADVEPEPETEAPTTQKTRGRFTARSSFSNKGASAPISTTTSPRTSRKPFIIRGESRTTPPSTSGGSFRPRGKSPTRIPKSSSSLRPTAPRLRTNNLKNSYTEPARTNSRNSARTSGTASRTRGRSNSRFKNANDNNENNHINQIPNDGKITVTHHIPSEVTISVVNGKITEYKNLITARPSTEVLQSNQYSTSIGPFGNPQLVIVSESTDLGENGATRVIKYVLQEIPTTSVIFTPTTIRGRKTSYSHIIPSTVYNVEAVTSTLAPEINPNVPLANILLSQLLLGNAQQQQINPLLALQGQAQLQGPATPVTEFKTRTTSYVTTVVDEKSTVIPLTFRGKEILTTIFDPKTNVITATEFITETFVTTPTLFPQQNPNQINSLLLPLLLQQQPQQTLQTANPLLGLSPDSIPTNNNNLPPANELYNNSPKPDILDVESNYDDVYVDESVEEETVVTEAPRKPFKKNRPKANKPSPRQSSVVTLYVSGRTPGEFSTVLSTVYDDSNVRKREAIYFESINLGSTDLPRFDEIYGSKSDVLLDNLLLPKDIENQTAENQIETQSLESIIGEVSRHISLGPSNEVKEGNLPPTEVLRILESDVNLDRFVKA